MAEILAEDFPAFSVVEVREACEFEPVRMAIGILGWASRKTEPPKALLNWARKRSRGYYRPHRRRPDGNEEYARCLGYLAGARRPRRSSSGARGSPRGNSRS